MKLSGREQIGTGAESFAILQNLYSSVRFRSPPPFTTQINKQLSGTIGHGP